MCLFIDKEFWLQQNGIDNEKFSCPFTNITFLVDEAKYELTLHGKLTKAFGVEFGQAVFPSNIPIWPQKCIQEPFSFSVIIFQLATQYYRQEHFIVVPDIITLIRPTIVNCIQTDRT